MEMRKLISFGRGSYVVSLPKSWITHNKLSKGSMLSLAPKNGEITISADLNEQKTERRQIRIDGDKGMDELSTEIITAYLSGYHVIEIVSKKIKDNGEEIKKVIMNLAGLEILEQTQSKITATFLLDMKEIGFMSLVRRMDNITRSLIIDVIACINGECNYLSIRERDNDVNRLHFLLLRSGRSELQNSNPWEIFIFLNIAERIEKIADRQKRIARCLEQLKLSKRYRDKLTFAYKEIQKSYLAVMTSYYQKDDKEALKIEISNRSRIEMCNKLLEEDSGLSMHEGRPKFPYSNEHMIITEVITNLKAMSASIKMIARAVMNMS